MPERPSRRRQRSESAMTQLDRLMARQAKLLAKLGAPTPTPTPASIERPTLADNAAAAGPRRHSRGADAASAHRGADHCWRAVHPRHSQLGTLTVAQGPRHRRADGAAEPRLDRAPAMAAGRQGAVAQAAALQLHVGRHGHCAGHVARPLLRPAVQRTRGARSRPEMSKTS